MSDSSCGCISPPPLELASPQVFTALVAVVCILFFFFREWARRHGIDLRLFSEDTGRKVMRVITQVSRRRTWRERSLVLRTAETTH